MKFTYYTIIGRDYNMIDKHLKNVTEYAGFNKLECEKELIVIQYTNYKIPKQTTDDIKQLCEETYGATVHEYPEPDPIFLTNLYACWNKGYEVASDGLVFRGGSDQVFSKDSFVALYDAYMELDDKKVILQANTIENQARAGASRHIMKEFGDTFEEFKYQEFEDYCNELTNDSKNKLIDIDEALEIWGHPTNFKSSRGIIDRVDGCSWLMTKNDYDTYGPMPPIEKGITGDVVIHDRLEAAGYKSYIVRDCITYHFVRGESR
jgi:hypothetical protein